MRDRKYVKALKTQDYVIESQLPPPEQATTSDVTEQSLPAAPSSDAEHAPAPPSSDVTDETTLPPPSTDAAPANEEAATSSDTASTSDAQ